MALLLIATVSLISITINKHYSEFALPHKNMVQQDLYHFMDQVEEVLN